MVGIEGREREREGEKFEIIMLSWCIVGPLKFATQFNSFSQARNDIYK